MDHDTNVVAKVVSVTKKDVENMIGPDLKHVQTRSIVRLEATNGYKDVTTLMVTGVGVVTIQNMPNLRELTLIGKTNDRMTLNRIINAPKLMRVTLKDCLVCDRAFDECRATLTMLCMYDVPTVTLIRDMPNLRYLKLSSCGEGLREYNEGGAHMVVGDGLDKLISLVIEDCSYDSVSVKSSVSLVHIGCNTPPKLIVDPCPNLVRAPLGVSKKKDAAVPFTDAERDEIKACDRLQLEECRSVDDFAAVAKYMFREYEDGDSSYFCDEFDLLLWTAICTVVGYVNDNDARMYVMYLPDTEVGPVAAKLPSDATGRGKVLPFFIAKETHAYDNVHSFFGTVSPGPTPLLMVTDVWVSSTLRGCRIAQRAVFVLKPWLVNGVLDSGIDFWNKLGVRSEFQFDRDGYRVPPTYMIKMMCGSDTKRSRMS